MSHAQPVALNPALPLTDKQEKFCQLAAFGSFNDAYRGAYDCAPNSVISGDIQRLRRDPRITHRIAEIQTAAYKPLAVDREWLLRWYLSRMTYDPAELTAWAKSACRYCHGEGHQYQWTPAEYLKAVADAEATNAPLPDIGGGLGFKGNAPPDPDCPECHGRGVGRVNFSDTSELSPSARAAFDGIKQTKDGIEILMADKHAAAKEFAKLSGMDVQQVRVLTDEIPSAEKLAELARDPAAITAAYQRFIGTTH